MFYFPSIVFRFLYAKSNFLHRLIWVHMHRLFFIHLSNTLSNIIIVIHFKSIYDYTQSLILIRSYLPMNQLYFAVIIVSACGGEAKTCSFYDCLGD